MFGRNTRVTQQAPTQAPNPRRAEIIAAMRRCPSSVGAYRLMAELAHVDRQVAR